MTLTVYQKMINERRDYFGITKEKGVYPPKKLKEIMGKGDKIKQEGE